MAALNKSKTHGNRPGSYKQFYERKDAPSFKTLNFPIKIRDILRFEKDNEEKDISVSVYGAEEWQPKKSKKKSFVPDKHPDHSESTMSEGEVESESEDEMTEENVFLTMKK